MEWELHQNGRRDSLHHQEEEEEEEGGGGLFPLPLFMIDSGGDCC